MKKRILFSLITGLMLAVGATQAAAPRAEEDLIGAARAGNAVRVQELIAAGADVNAHGPDESALTAASHRGHAEIVKALVEAGADVNAQGYDGSALMNAAWLGHVEMAQALLEVEGIDVNAKEDRGGWTALITAASQDHADLVRILLAAGADKTITDNQNQTAFDIATNDEIKAMLEETYVKSAAKR